MDGLITFLDGDSFDRSPSTTSHIGYNLCALDNNILTIFHNLGSPFGYHMLILTSSARGTCIILFIMHLFIHIFFFFFFLLRDLISSRVQRSSSHDQTTTLNEFRDTLAYDLIMIFANIFFE